jgi:hypothetical protein
MSLDVSFSGIHCYSGCLTESPAQIIGASPDCHDGSQMHRFLFICAVFVILALAGTIAFRSNCAVRWRGYSTKEPASDLPEQILQGYVWIILLVARLLSFIIMFCPLCIMLYHAGVL